MAAYKCSECDKEIDGDPWWYHPLVITSKDETGALGMNPVIGQSAEPPDDLAGGALPFHRECLDKRLAD